MSHVIVNLTIAVPIPVAVPIIDAHNPAPDMIEVPAW